METKEKYQEWLSASGETWQQALVIGLQYSDNVGVIQERGQPDYGVDASVGMIETTIDDVIVAYEIFLIQSSK